MSNNRYGQVHKTVRNRWRLKVEAGGVACWRCAKLIKPGEPWDLGHVDGGRPGQYAGPEHRKCNRAQPAIEAWAARKREAATADPGPEGRYAGMNPNRWSRHWLDVGKFLPEWCPDCKALGRACKDADGAR